MSLPDHELDDPRRECERCGAWCDRRVCRECLTDVMDVYADEKCTESLTERSAS